MGSYKKCSWTLVLFLSAGTALQGAEQWRRIATANFELYTTASDRTGRNVIQTFERARAFFVQALRFEPVSVNPVRLIGFKSEKEYLPYKPGSAAAYYMPAPDRDYIVIGDVDVQVDHSALHEYAHLMLKHAGLKPPVWLNEGLAELYASMVPVGKKVRVGDVLPGRAYSLQMAKWMPLDQLTAVDHDSAYYNEANRAGLFYAQSWLLTHMLALDEAYYDRFNQFFLAMAQGGTTTEEAVRKVWGKSLEDLYKDLQGYSRADRIRVMLYDLTLPKKAEVTESGEAPPWAGDLMKAQLLRFREREKSEAIFAKLAADYPDQVEVAESFGYMKLRRGDRPGAVAEFGRAAAAGSRNARMHVDYATLLADDQAPAAVAALRKALEIEPEFRDARTRLAEVYLQVGKAGAAMSELTSQKLIMPDRAFRHFLLLSHALARMNQFDQAQKSAERAAGYAANAWERESAEQMRSYAERAVARAAAQAAGAATPEQVVLPGADRSTELLARLEGQDDPARAILFESVEGKFTALECIQPQARMTVATAAGARTYFIENPEFVTIEGAAGATIEMVCGEQPTALNVRITYRPTAAGEQKAKDHGKVSKIEFLP